MNNRYNQAKFLGEGGREGEGHILKLMIKYCDGLSLQEQLQVNFVQQTHLLQTDRAKVLRTLKYFQHERQKYFQASPALHQLQLQQQQLISQLQLVQQRLIMGGNMMEAGKELDSKENNWREEKMETGALSPDNNNTSEKNKNGAVSPEPDNQTLFNNGEAAVRIKYFYQQT